MKPAPKFIDLTKPFVSKYIFCMARANHAQIHVSICEKRCKENMVCKEYQEYLEGVKKNYILNTPTIKEGANDYRSQDN